MRINGKVLQEMLDDMKTMKLGTPKFNQKYIDFVDNAMISNEQWRKKVEEWGKDDRFNFDAYSLFNEALFLQIPSHNNLIDDFAEIISEKSKENAMFFHFKELYQELQKLENSNYDMRVFKNSSSLVQWRALNSGIGFRDYQRYLDIANKDVQDKVFEKDLEHGRLLYSLKNSENYLKHQAEVRAFISLELEEKFDLVDVVDGKEILRRCSDNIFRKLPDDVRYDFMDLFTEKYTEVIKQEKLTFKELQSALTGVELLEVLDQNEFEQKEGEVYHFDFDSSKMDVQKLLDLSKKYKISCSLTIRSCADLSIEKIEILEKHFGIDIKEIKFKQDDLGKYQQEPYSIEDYIKCRKIIDTITNDVEKEAKVMQDDPDRDKKVCGIIMRRLANLIRYNYEYYNRLVMEKNTKEKLTTENEDIMNAGLIGGLLNGTCFCAGYAEIVRNTLSCCGIECRYVAADNKDKDEFGHAWNQVKLDGKWYNLDLTWDADRIVESTPTKYFLKSDNDFGHDEYVPRRLTEKCTESITNAHAYMRYRAIDQNVEFNFLLRQAVVKKGITTSEVNACARVASVGEKDIQDLVK